MKKIIFGLTVFLFSSLLLTGQANWNTAGNTIISTEWFGGTINSTIPLNFEHRAWDQPINFFTTRGVNKNLRMQITHNAQGITRVGIMSNQSPTHDWPVSHLHIGQGTSVTQSGYRDWMDVGTFYSGATDNMYVGLRTFPTIGDGAEAVINWGNNPINPGTTDRLRFIFTAVGNLGDGIADTYDGLEIGRMVAINTGGATPVIEPRFGVGNFFTGNVGDPQFTLDVNGQASIRDVAQDNRLTQILVRDPNNYGRIMWRDASSIAQNDNWGTQVVITDGTLSGDGTAGNPLSVVGGGGGGLLPDNGLHQHGSFVHLGGGLKELTTINLNGNNLLFTFPNNNANNRIGIGTTNPVAKVDIERPATTPGESNPIALRVTNNDLANGTSFSGFSVGVRSTINASNKSNTAGYFEAFEAENAIGIQSLSEGVVGNTKVAIGGFFRAKVAS